MEKWWTSIFIVVIVVVWWVYTTVLLYKKGHLIKGEGFKKFCGYTSLFFWFWPVGMFYIDRRLIDPIVAIVNGYERFLTVFLIVYLIALGFYYPKNMGQEEEERALRGLLGNSLYTKIIKFFSILWPIMVIVGVPLVAGIIWIFTIIFTNEGIKLFGLSLFVMIIAIQLQYTVLHIIPYEIKKIYGVNNKN